MLQLSLFFNFGMLTKNPINFCPKEEFNVGGGDKKLEQILLIHDLFRSCLNVKFSCKLARSLLSRRLRWEPWDVVATAWAISHLVDQNETIFIVHSRGLYRTNGNPYIFQINVGTKNDRPATGMTFVVKTNKRIYTCEFGFLAIGRRWLICH